MTLPAKRPGGELLPPLAPWQSGPSAAIQAEGLTQSCFRCSECGVSRGATDSLGVDIDAVRKALVGAFEELQPALADLFSAAVSRCMRDVADSASRAPQPPARPDDGLRPSGMPPEPKLSPMSETESLKSEPPQSARSPTGMRMNNTGSASASFHCSPSRIVPTSEESAGSSLFRRSDGKMPHARPPAHTPLTVQNVQASVAQALLEQVGFSFTRQETPRTVVAQIRHRGGKTKKRAPGCIFPEVDASDDEGVSSLEMETAHTGGSVSVEQLPSAESQVSLAAFRTSLEFTQATTTSPGGEFRSDQRVTSGQLLRARISELAMQAHQISHTRRSASSISDATVTRSFDWPPSSTLPTCLLVSGLIPWSGERWCCSSLYQWAVRTVGGLATVVAFLPSIGSLNLDCKIHDTNCWQRDGFSRVSLPVGAVLVLVPFVLKRRQEQLHEAFLLLSGLKLRRQFQESLAGQLNRDAIVFALLWLSVIGVTIVGDCMTHVERGDVHIVTRTTVHSIVYAMLSGVTLSLCYAMVFVCRSLSTLIDVFCCDVVGQSDLDDLSHVWNLTQAVVRKASDSVEAAFLVLCIVVMIVVPLLVIDIAFLGLRSSQLLLVLPGWLVACGVAYMLLLAAGISEKCTRVPSLVNAIFCGKAMDVGRQRAVDYITSSAAGFYILDMRLTAAVVVKLMYVCCVVVVGMLTRLASGGDEAYA